MAEDDRLKKALFRSLHDHGKELPKDKRPYLQAYQGPAGNACDDDERER